MIRVWLPPHLQNLAGTGKEIEVDAVSPVTIRTVIDAVEAAYPVLKGTIRDQRTQARRPMVRFFVEESDWSHRSIDDELPASIADGSEPLWIVGAISGG